MYSKTITRSKKPIIISTWEHGLEANKTAMKVMNLGGTALDAVEKGGRVSESDPSIHSVGYGGHPDQDGHVTLDASIMDHLGNAGSVGFLEGIKHPVSVARKVMESSDHVMLVGLGAQKFALQKGFKKENLLTNKTKNIWLKWKGKKNQNNRLKIAGNHDTISLLAQDIKGNLAGSSTTSGMAYKLNGRLGDSPLIGAGLYINNKIGGAGATGKGEEIIKTVGSFLVVELMSQGYHPNDACNEALMRIINNHEVKPNFQVAYIALRKDGATGAAAIKKGFSYALYSKDKNSIYRVKGVLSN